MRVQPKGHGHRVAGQNGLRIEQGPQAVADHKISQVKRHAGVARAIVALTGRDQHVDAVSPDGRFDGHGKDVRNQHAEGGAARFAFHEYAVKIEPVVKCATVKRPLAGQLRFVRAEIEPVGPGPEGIPARHGEAFIEGGHVGLCIHPLWHRHIRLYRKIGERRLNVHGFTGGQVPKRRCQVKRTDPDIVGCFDQVTGGDAILARHVRQGKNGRLQIQILGSGTVDAVDRNGVGVCGQIMDKGVGVTGHSPIHPRLADGHVDRRGFRRRRRQDQGHRIAVGHRDRDGSVPVFRQGDIANLSGD